MGKKGYSVMLENRELIKKYIDQCIRFWRNTEDIHKSKVAIYYIDAYQSVRLAVFGEILPEKHRPPWTKYLKKQSPLHTGSRK